MSVLPSMLKHHLATARKLSAEIDIAKQGGTDFFAPKSEAPWVWIGSAKETLDGLARESDAALSEISIKDARIADYKHKVTDYERVIRRAYELHRADQTDDAYDVLRDCIRGIDGPSE